MTARLSAKLFAVILTATCMLIAMPVLAQDASSAPAAEPQQEVAPDATTDTPAQASAEAPAEVTSAPPAETAPEPATAPSTEEKPTEVAEEAPDEMPKGQWKAAITDRISIGYLVENMIAEYGFQLEASSKWFGFNGRWAAIQPYPDDLGFSYLFGFAFHYYPFGDGPSGMYVGPGVVIMHLTRNTDPVDAYMNPPESGIVKTLEMEFDLITPYLEVGYRYTFPFYLTLGIEASVGYAVSDQTPLYDSGVYAVVTPVVGFTF